MQYRKRSPHYRYYLLACWEEEGTTGQGPVRWRFSLQDPTTGQRWAFPDLEELVAGLHRQLANARQKDEK